MATAASIQTTASTLSLSDYQPDDSEEAAGEWLSAGYVMGVLLFTLLFLCYCCLDLLQDDAPNESENAVSSHVDGDDMEVQLETQVAGKEVGSGGSFHSQSTIHNAIDY